MDVNLYLLLALLATLLVIAYLLTRLHRVRGQLSLIKDALMDIKSGNLNRRVLVRESDMTKQICYDINEIAMSSQSRLIQQKQSEQAYKRLMTSLSHDVKTPLASLVGYLEAVESKIEEFLRTRSAAAQAEAEKAPYLSAGYVPTSVSEDVYKAIQYCQLERGIVVLHGDAGIGKTRGAARFVQDNPANAIYIRCTPVGGTLTAMLRQLGTALKLPATRNRLELSMAIHDRLKGTDKVIIIDEAQNLRFDALEELRSLSDPDDLTGESGTGICLIGNSEVYSRMLGKQEAQFAQQFSRVRFRRRYSTADVKLADVEKLFPTLADGSHGKELAFMTGVCRSKWGIRGAMSVYTNAVRNENTSLDGLRGIAASMGVGVLS